MSDQNKNNGLTRRDFVRTIGAASLAAAGIPVAQALAAEAPAAPGKSAVMPKRKLGKIEVEVPILALGGMFDTINNQLLLRQALNWGITYWDTAEAYGNGLSEDGYGRYLARNPEARKDIFLVTKLVPKEGEQNLSARLDKSLERLHTSYVDLFFIHGITTIGEMTPAFKDWGLEMKKAGKIKNFGFSTHANMDENLLGAAKLDWIDAVMFSYNFRIMHEAKMREALDACAKAGTGLVAMKTQGGGPVKSDSEAELKMAGHFLERGFTDKQAKIKAVWEEPRIASLCSQMPSLTILSANVAAARDQAALAKNEIESLRHFASQTKGDYCAGCGRICLSAMDGAVPVNEVMRALMYHREYGEPELARQTFAALPEQVRQRLAEMDYSQAELACPQGLAIAELMHQASEMLA